MNTSDTASKSTRSPFVRDIRQLLDDDETALMGTFCAQAIHEFAKEVVSAEKPDWSGTLADGMWPGWITCAEQVLAKFNWRKAA